MSEQSSADGLSIKLNGIAQCFSEVSTISELLEHLNMANRRLAVEVDGEIVPRSTYGDKKLYAGAQVEVITAVGGG